jgi:hypothetical protein
MRTSDEVVGEPPKPFGDKLREQFAVHNQFPISGFETFLFRKLIRCASSLSAIF